MSIPSPIKDDFSDDLKLFEEGENYYKAYSLKGFLNKQAS